jgi:hypothetical protein
LALTLRIIFFYRIFSDDRPSRSRGRLITDRMRPAPTSDLWQWPPSLSGCVRRRTARCCRRLTVSAALRRSHLGRTDLIIAPLCFGTMLFGESTSEEGASALLDRATEHGLNFFDTAEM